LIEADAQSGALTTEFHQLLSHQQVYDLADPTSIDKLQTDLAPFCHNLPEATTVHGIRTELHHAQVAAAQCEMRIADLKTNELAEARDRAGR
jgi:hypothetical protein